MSLENLLNTIKNHEGFKAKVYKCPEGKLTIGYGFNIEDNNLPLKVADFWLEYLVLNEFIPELKTIFKNFENFTENQKIALTDMLYNLGKTRFLKFRNTINYINFGLWQKASQEILNSKWARQVKNRAFAVSELLTK
jgi:lysozyme